MKIFTNLQVLLGAALLVGAVACGDDSGDSSTSGSGGAGTGTGTGTTNTTTTAQGPTTTTGTDTTTGTGGAGGDTSTSTDTSTGTAGGGGEGGEGGGAPVFVFAEDAYEDYAQIDRHGAVEAGTAGILAEAGLGFGGEDLSVRDEYNASNPEADAALAWAGELTASVSFFHTNLDDDLEAAGFTPATGDTTIAQALPVIVPDTIKYDPTEPTGYPNGRALTDQVVDITLAAVLLDLGADGQTITSFADIPLNPAANDVEFSDEFPFLAPPH